MLLNLGYGEKIVNRPFHEEQLLPDFHLVLLSRYSMPVDSLVLTEALVEYLSLLLEDLPNTYKTDK